MTCERNNILGSISCLIAYASDLQIKPEKEMDAIQRRLKCSMPLGVALSSSSLAAVLAGQPRRLPAKIVQQSARGFRAFRSDRPTEIGFFYFRDKSKTGPSKIRKQMKNYMVDLPVDSRFFL